MIDKEEIKDSLVEEFHNNGQLKSRGNYKDGNTDSFWERFYENDQLKRKGNYKKRTFKDVFFKIRKWLKTTLPKNTQ